MVHTGSAPHTMSLFEIKIDCLYFQYESETGFRWIFTATGYYTKWMVAYPMKDKSAASVLECLKRMVYTHGPPRIILSDNGTEFVNTVN